MEKKQKNPFSALVKSVTLLPFGIIYRPCHKCGKMFEQPESIEQEKLIREIYYASTDLTMCRPCAAPKK